MPPPTLTCNLTKAATLRMHAIHVHVHAHLKAASSSTMPQRSQHEKPLASSTTSSTSISHLHGLHGRPGPRCPHHASRSFQQQVAQPHLLQYAMAATPPVTPHCLLTSSKLGWIRGGSQICKSTRGTGYILLTSLPSSSTSSFLSSLSNVQR